MHNKSIFFFFRSKYNQQFLIKIHVIHDGYNSFEIEDALECNSITDVKIKLYKWIIISVSGLLQFLCMQNRIEFSAICKEPATAVQRKHHKSHNSCREQNACVHHQQIHNFWNSSQFSRFSERAIVML